ncbi:dephospho-CoA kinase [Amorphus sp. 3PC139-8]|uniref:dephospho-CoA kinase n=1 Tax=Amorphus sp. 3PC139-8 TaxID=2735676 RepID=UPI00345D0B64
MIVLGLTGSIGMGKSTTAKMFAAAGVPVYDADRAVHALYRGRAVPVIEEAFPGVVVDDVVDRTRLGEKVLGDRAAMQRLEALIHPMVREEERAFLARVRAAHAPCAVLDIPLLFETGREASVDAVVVVTASPEVQSARVLARDGMTEQRFEAIRAKQTPDADKRRRAHFLVDTGHGMASAERSVASILKAVSFMTGKSESQPL